MSAFNCMTAAWSELARAYGLRAFRSVVPVATGDEASVWRAETERGTVCLKILHAGLDTTRALLMEHLRGPGLPFPRLIENTNGDALTRFGSETIGIWAWSHGSYWKALSGSYISAEFAEAAGALNLWPELRALALNQAKIPPRRRLPRQHQHRAVGKANCHPEPQ